MNHHPGLCSFTCSRVRPFGVRGHDHLTSRSTRLAFTSVARCPPWFSCKRKTGCPSNIWLDCLLQSVCCLPASPALSSRWSGALTPACPSDNRLRKGPCSVNLCFCTSDDGIDGSGQCFLKYEDSLHATDIIILTESKETERQTDRNGRVLRPYRGI